MRSIEHIVIVGVGGIGSWLLPPLLRFLNSENFAGPITLWDGDHFSLKNLSRQEASTSLIGRSKAEAQAEHFRAEYPTLHIWNRNEFVTADNAHEAVPERAIVFACVDNHPARALLARQAELRREVCLLSAGNEKYDGNVCVMLRQGGRPVTVGLLERHPEIATAKRGDRAAMGCQELAAAGDTQLLVTNFMAATALLVAFHLLWSSERRIKLPVPQEIFFDVAQGSMSLIPAAQAVNA